MAFPVDVTLREVTFGPAFDLTSGAPLAMKVTFTPSRSMVRGAPAGSPGVAREYSVTTDEGMEGSISIPVTDQSGWFDGNGNAITVDAGGNTHTYRVKVAYLNDQGREVGTQPAPKSIALPTEDGSPVDLDALIPVTTTGGVTISIPDSWSASVSAAEASAAAAEAALIDSDAAVAGFISDPLSETALALAGFSGGGGPLPAAVVRSVIVVTGTETRPADADVVVWVDPDGAGAVNATATDLIINPSESTGVLELVDAKGDLLVGSAADTLVRLAVGANGKILSANSATASGLEWIDPPAGGGGSVSPGVTSAIKPKSGHWFGPYNAPGTGSYGGVANRLDLVPVWVPSSTPVSEIAVMVATSGAGSSVRVGIFNAKADGMPGTVRLDAGTVDTSSTGVKSIGISTTLTAGLYYLAAVPQGGTTPVMRAFSGVDRSNFGWDWDEGYFTGEANNSTNYLSVAGVTGALADLSSASFTYQTKDTIKVGVRAA